MKLRENRAFFSFFFFFFAHRMQMKGACGVTVEPVVLTSLGYHRIYNLPD